MHMQVRTKEGPAKLSVAKTSITLKSRFGGTKVIELASDALMIDPSDPAGLLLNQPNAKAPTACGLSSPQERDLLVLAAQAFTSLDKEASFEGKCKVWEGEGYGDYYGLIHGQVHRARAPIWPLAPLPPLPPGLLPPRP